MEHFHLFSRKEGGWHSYKEKANQNSDVQTFAMQARFFFFFFYKPKNINGYIFKNTFCNTNLIFVGNISGTCWSKT